MHLTSTIPDAMDVTEIRPDGTSRTYPTSYLGNEDGTVTITWQNGTVENHPDEATARAAYGWTGLIFTQAQKDQKRRVEALTPPAEWVNGQWQHEVHPLLADYITALNDGDIARAAREVEQFSVRQGYAQYEGSWTERRTGVSIIRMRKQVATKSGRVLLPGDIALAELDFLNGDFTVYSARTQTPIGVPNANYFTVLVRG